MDFFQSFVLELFLIYAILSFAPSLLTSFLPIFFLLIYSYFIRLFIHDKDNWFDE